MNGLGRSMGAGLGALAMLVGLAAAAPATAQTSLPTPKTASTVTLDRTAAGAIMPPKVFFRGQTATVQARNSAGLKLTDGELLLVALVDTAGYSSSLQQSYQAYLLTEFPVQLGEQRLAPGAYGFGYVAGDRMVVMDLGGHEVLHTTTTHDAAMPRPNPLQILPAPQAGSFRLYLGRNYVVLTPSVSR